MVTVPSFAESLTDYPDPLIQLVERQAELEQPTANAELDGHWRQVNQFLGQVATSPISSEGRNAAPVNVFATLTKEREREPATPRRRRPKGRNRELVEQALIENPGRQWTSREMADATGLSHNAASVQLRQLRDEGFVNQPTYGVYEIASPNGDHKEGPAEKAAPSGELPGSEGSMAEASAMLPGPFN